MRQLIRKGLGNRFVRFASIGLFCLVIIQIPTMLLLMELGATALPANAAGFVLSAVINFFAQGKFTFDNDVAENRLVGLLKFFGTSAVSLGISSLVFDAVFYGLNTWAVAASFTGAVAGTGFNFGASLVFRTFGSKPQRVEFQNPVFNLVTVPGQEPVLVTGDPGETEQVPDLKQVRRATAGKTLAFFMPAYKEEGNLERVVASLVSYLDGLDLLDYRIFIVNDGSPDNTGAIAESLQAVFHGKVVALHHEKNRGYGGALITGFNAVVESGFNLWAFYDGDGQFSNESIGTLLVSLLDDDGEFTADMAVGYRIGRRNADSAWRFWLGRAWHFFGKFVVGNDAAGEPLLSVHDVDCGIKVGRRKSLARIVEQLSGQAAAISPELISRANLDNQVIVERGVMHLSRQAGTSTGDDPRVMIRSAWNILLLGLRLRRKILFGWMNDPRDDAQNTLIAEGWKQ